MSPVTSKVFFSSIQVMKHKPAENFYVTIKGNELSEKLLYPELMKPCLNVQEIDTTEYESIFNHLSSDEKKAVRLWTMTANDEGYYSDGTKALATENNTFDSYEFNRKLYERRPLDDFDIYIVRNLTSAINKLPHTTGNFIRICEYSTPPNENPWINGTINVGDIVTNTSFMSASNYLAYVGDRLDGEHIIQNTTTFALFKFVNSNQFAPLLTGVASLLVEEREHLAPIGCAFRVLGITYAKPENEHSQLKVRVGVLLEDSSENRNRKDIYTGELI
ncbi:hypothetical protein [Yersinia enterocolitica]|uniref:hypothetical protein n=1 Tax=Yersinia enterocolitica TaxID=630 RepID=UPI001F56C581|nr:hypothetical protein [Yersinia enterocolitica]HEI6731037.1 hypothetical protein [Yersinia enterocolitica]